MIDGHCQRIGQRRHERVYLDVDVRGSSFFTGPFQRRQMPGKANSGRGSSPFSENQCHVAGFTPSRGSQNDDAGTRQRRCSNESFQTSNVDSIQAAE